MPLSGTMAPPWRFIGERLKEDVNHEEPPLRSGSTLHPTASLQCFDLDRCYRRGRRCPYWYLFLRQLRQRPHANCRPPRGDDRPCPCGGQAGASPANHNWTARRARPEKTVIGVVECVRIF